ncbi:hypothetical protein QBC45DRAFT_423568 [Copromyces sp. CBS 386.78]|nr:hypothetical protein QBC45DRAFT_423568 [Copromyces sp. CBS 386.78]
MIQCYLRIRIRTRDPKLETSVAQNQGETKELGDSKRNYKPRYRHLEVAWADGGILMGKARVDTCRDPSKLDPLSFTEYEWSE